MFLLHKRLKNKGIFFSFGVIEASQWLMYWKSCFNGSWLICPDLFSIGISFEIVSLSKTQDSLQSQCQKMLFEKKSIFSTSIWNHYLKIIPELLYSVLSFRVPNPLSWACCSKVWFACCVWQGDFTRTGERKLAGVMKDGVNSANRYYLNRFRDAYRQAVIGKSIISIKLSCGICKRLLNHICFIFLTDCFFFPVA